MASKRDLVCGGIVAVLGIVLSSGCRMGLPPEPPGADATDAEATIPEYQTSPDPFARSAFAGETLSEGGGHAGHRPASTAGEQDAVGDDMAGHTMTEGAKP